jgi:NAD(P)-dependent dehydrogenase (short-subunit alcohol dehydrogenase family)
MLVSLEGRTVVVTGAAGGLGREVCRLAADAGATVVGLDIADFTADGVEARQADMSDPASIDGFVASLEPSVDVLCNVAGLPQTAPTEKVLRVNFLGLRHLTESLAPSMSPAACVVNVASNAGNGWPARQETLESFLDLEGFGAGADWVDSHVDEIGDPYIFSKELVQLYTRRRSHTLYRELGVRMNCVSPGEMETPMMAEFRKAVTDKIIDAVAAAGTLGRIATPEEVAPAVVFLASPLAAYCCGEIFNVDGGWTAVNLTNQVDYSLFA